MESGQKITEPDAYLRPKYPDPSGSIVQAAVGGMMAQALSGQPLEEFFGAWEADVRALAKFPLAEKGLASMPGVLSQALSAVGPLFGAPSTSEAVRLAAALRMAAESDFSLDEMFVGQIVLYRMVSESFLRSELAPTFGEFVRKGWRGRLGFGAAFVAPRRTIPEIRAACDSIRSGLALACGILLAGNGAVSITTPPGIVKAWQQAVDRADRMGTEGLGGTAS